MGNTRLCDPEIAPAQLSVAVGAVKLVTEHSEVMEGNNATSAEGAKTSSMVKFNVTIASQPFSPPPAMVNVAVVLLAT